MTCLPFGPVQSPKLLVKRVVPDSEIQEEIVEESKNRFLKILLPEMMSRYFSSLKQMSNDSSLHNLVCYCQKRERPPMVSCVGHNCTFKVFHAQFVGVRSAKKNWKSPQC